MFTFVPHIIYSGGKACVEIVTKIIEYLKDYPTECVTSAILVIGIALGITLIIVYKMWIYNKWVKGKGKPRKKKIIKSKK